MTSLLPRYQEYKDSGVEWLGQVPDHWRMVRGKFLFDERVEKGYPDEPLLAATQTKGVVPKDHYESRTVTAQKDFHLLKLVEEGDYVISLRSFQGGIEYAHYRGIISPAYSILKPSTRLNVSRDYFEFLFKSLPFINGLTLFVTGIREGQNIDYNRLSRSLLPLPSAEEQAAIGRFLRHVNGVANRLLRTKRRLIALLNEQKQAIIHHAVTKGLNPDASMKPSGIDWLGDIPTHWQLVRLRHLVSSIDQGNSPQAEAILADEHSWGVLKSGCVNHGIFRETEHKRLPSTIKIDERIAVHVGDVLVSRASGSPKLVGSVGRVRSLSYKLLLSDKTFRLNFRQPVLADFLVSAMNTKYFRVQVEQAISGAEGLANNLPVSSLRSFQIAVPPVEESLEINSWLLNQLSHIDDSLVRINSELTLIQEYRTRLIADVVTGKLDVRDAVLPDAFPGLEDSAELLEQELEEEGVLLEEDDSVLEELNENE